jgi:hypothetical protein
VSGGGTFTTGTPLTVTATANSDYTFANWTNNGTVVSPAASYTFTLSGQSVTQQWRSGRRRRNICVG